MKLYLVYFMMCGAATGGLLIGLLLGKWSYKDKERELEHKQQALEAWGQALQSWDSLMRKEAMEKIGEICGN